MVFQKKGAVAAKNFQPKKNKKQVVADDNDSDMFDDMDDSDDFEDGSDEEMPVQKTPQNKIPKGRQSLSEKKVTFDMPAKNTPGKTPNKNNSFMKKTPTPAKGKRALEEFKGIKGGKPQQNKGTAEEDDDEDDDSDLDFDIDDDDDDDDDDIVEGEGDEEEDDDDDDDDDDEDDDDDDDDEEEEQIHKQKKANPKQKNNAEQNKPKTAKIQTPNSKIVKNEVVSPKKSPQKNTETQTIEMQRRKERDLRMLYVGGLPADVTAEEIQTLSPDIQDVIIPNSNRKSQRLLYAFLCFASEAKAEANFKTLQSKKFRGQLLNIDFVGEKSQKKPTTFEPKINEKKLYVTCIPIGATIAQVAVHFPKAIEIIFNRSKYFRTANINFENEEDATEAFKVGKAIDIDGQKLIVMHSTDTPNKKRKFVRKHKNNRQGGMNKKNGNDKQGGNPAKKIKFTKKEESSDD